MDNTTLIILIILAILLGATWSAMRSISWASPRGLTATVGLVGTRAFFYDGCWSGAWASEPREQLQALIRSNWIGGEARCKNRWAQIFRKLPVEDPETGDVLAVIETPRGSRNKYAFDLDLGAFRLKAVLPQGNVFPFDFGFIPSTKADDGSATRIPLVAFLMDWMGRLSCGAFAALA
jgi:Inorganic pyrophosphatase